MRPIGIYDFIIVGGGTAGLLVAGRLASNPRVKVLVIEAGAGDPENVEMITTPALAFHLRETEYDWAYETTLIDKPGYKRVEAANTRGKVLGGSSCLNYYTWLRGSASTYDDWVEFGGEEWSWNNCSQSFITPVAFHDLERILDRPPLNVAANTEDSLLQIGPATPIPLAELLTSAWKSRGYPVTNDIFSGHVDGMTHVTRTIHNGQRSTSNCFIKGLPNVDILSKSHAERIIIKDGSAEGVLVHTPRGPEYYKADAEVVVSCGVFESPKLLMLSGVGSLDHLSSHGLPCIVDSEHVGQHLQDHPVVPHVFQVKEEYSMDRVLRAGPEHEQALKMYRETKTGPFSSGLLEMSAFARIDQRLETCKEWRHARESIRADPLGPGGQPHLEFDFLPCFAKPFQPHIPSPETGGHLTVVVSLLRPQSRGTVKLRSGNAADQPEICLNYLSDPVDIIGLREGIRFIDEVLLKGDETKELIIGEYPNPLPRESDEEMGRAIHERVTTGYHPCGTCRIGKTISQGVVDPHLRVHGINRLRVIDASVIPIIPDGRIQNAVYMVAEKGAHMIKQDYQQWWPHLHQPWSLTGTLRGCKDRAQRIWSLSWKVVGENREVLRQALE
ncbi:CAZyme family AA3 [Paecilomyces variotii]|nr:CAZyme family AA3 [Paecilomyces variotii]KAJ9228293.1 CAZyme family AA3 [Paecilomyces variotii]